MPESVPPTEWKRANTDWLHDAKWGLMFHFLATAASSSEADVSIEAWNQRVDGFDVEGLTKQLVELSIPYFLITLGQNSGHYCAPSTTYDRLTGIHPSKCSRRDLPADLIRAFKPHGIRLMLYLPPAAPINDMAARKALGFDEESDARRVRFKRNWEAIIREWSDRYGRDVHGWWIDGPYEHEPYRSPDTPNFRSLAGALKSGNPNSLIAFNPGLRTPITGFTEIEDYTAGEIERDLTVAPGHFTTGVIKLMRYERFINGAQFHLLSILGEWWGMHGEPRLPDELAIGYTKYINKMCGTITWDVPHTPTGLILPAYVDQLRAMRDHLKPR